MTEKLKNAGVVGYPVTPIKDVRHYVADKGVLIETELEIDCNERK